MITVYVLHLCRSLSSGSTPESEDYSVLL